MYLDHPSGPMAKIWAALLPRWSAGLVFIGSRSIPAWAVLRTDARRTAQNIFASVDAIRRESDGYCWRYRDVVMVVRFTKPRNEDRPPTFTCIRDDGTTTGMPSTLFFVHHDLTHYAVET